MISIYTDGSAIGNPGPGGYGVILEFNGVEKTLSQGFRKTTNNRMELLAVIVGLEALKKKMPIKIYSDSKYVTDSVTKGWLFNWLQKDNFANKANPDLWKRYYELHKVYEPTFVWIKGHNDHPQNERCDVLATTAARSKNLLIDTNYENR